MKVPDQKLLRALQSPFPLSVSKVANLHLRTQEEAASQGPSYRYGYWVLQAGASGRGRMGGRPHRPGLRAAALCANSLPNPGLMLGH